MYNSNKYVFTGHMPEGWQIEDCCIVGKRVRWYASCEVMIKRTTHENIELIEAGVPKRGRRCLLDFSERLGQVMHGVGYDVVGDLGRDGCLGSFPRTRSLNRR